MPQSWTSGHKPTDHLNAFCLTDPEHGLIGAGPYDVVTGQITNHFVRKHPDLQLVIQGDAFDIVVASLRCDVCNVIAEPPYWTYKVTPEIFPGDADGLWLVCDPCHQLIAADDEQAVVDRYCRVTRETAPSVGVDDVTLSTIKDVYRLMRTATVTRDQVAP